MQYKASAWYWKLLAWLLVALCLAGGFFSAMVTGINLSYGYYDPDYLYQTSWRTAELVSREAATIVNQLQKENTEDTWEQLLGNSDLRFIVLEEETGKVAAAYTEGMDLDIPEIMADRTYMYIDNYYLMQPGYTGTFLEDVYVLYGFFELESGCSYTIDTFGYRGSGGSAYFDSDFPIGNYRILFLLPQELTKFDDSIGQDYALYLEMSRLGQWMPLLLVGCAVVLLAAVIFLCIQTGRRPGLEQRKATWLEKIPFELHLFAAFGAVAGIFALIVAVSDLWLMGYLQIWEWHVSAWLCTAGAAICGIVLVELLLTFVLRLKLRIFVRNTLCY